MCEPDSEMNEMKQHIANDVVFLTGKVVKSQQNVHH